MTSLARILDGKAAARNVYRRLQDEIDHIMQGLGRPPGLAVLLVGEDHASEIYVRNKAKAAESLGIRSKVVRLGADVRPAELNAQIARLNNDPFFDSVLLQLPLPKHLDPEEHIERIDPAKDVDGVHPFNVGRAAAGCKAFQPCTPLGIRELLLANDIDAAGKHVVIVGRGRLVGLPLARLLLKRRRGGDATVTVCHSRTTDLAGHTSRADILVLAAGQAGLVDGSMVKPGAVVVDAGINRVDDPSAPKGSRLAGDADFESVSKVAGAITPVPGGVGPMTVAMLMANAVDAARRSLSMETTIT
jgi:methylenetetrahydrofolate dehydrogenase (NADP+)/methenyltetrahydrofolate cyclohydrolase